MIGWLASHSPVRILTPGILPKHHTLKSSSRFQKLFAQQIKGRSPKIYTRSYEIPDNPKINIISFTDSSNPLLQKETSLNNLNPPKSFTPPLSPMQSQQYPSIPNFRQFDHHALLTTIYHGLDPSECALPFYSLIANPTKRALNALFPSPSLPPTSFKIGSHQPSLTQPTSCAPLSHTSANSTYPYFKNSKSNQNTLSHLPIHHTPVLEKIPPILTILPNKRPILILSQPNTPCVDVKALPTHDAADFATIKAIVLSLDLADRHMQQFLTRVWALRNTIKIMNPAVFAKFTQQIQRMRDVCHAVGEFEIYNTNGDIKGRFSKRPNIAPINIQNQPNKTHSFEGIRHTFRSSLLDTLGGQATSPSEPNLVNANQQNLASKTTTQNEQGNSEILTTQHTQPNKLPIMNFKPYNLYHQQKAFANQIQHQATQYPTHPSILEKADNTSSSTPNLQKEPRAQGSETGTHVQHHFKQKTPNHNHHHLPDIGKHTTYQFQDNKDPKVIFEHTDLPEKESIIDLVAPPPPPEQHLSEHKSAIRTSEKDHPPSSLTIPHCESNSEHKNVNSESQSKQKNTQSQDTLLTQTTKHHHFKNDPHSDNSNNQNSARCRHQNNNNSHHKTGNRNFHSKRHGQTSATKSRKYNNYRPNNHNYRNHHNNRTHYNSKYQQSGPNIQQKYYNDYPKPQFHNNHNHNNINNHHNYPAGGFPEHVNQKNQGFYPGNMGFPGQRNDVNLQNPPYPPFYEHPRPYPYPNQSGNMNLNIGFHGNPGNPGNPPSYQLPSMKRVKNDQNLGSYNANFNSGSRANRSGKGFNKNKNNNNTNGYYLNDR